ncbi:amidohydrolase family protein [Paramixta manurensis]|uniref:Amidohydrolase family protein n=1 Tax=Paramixta manurensis TaxID=2740817 RepID=A0A6M8U6A3_9GAMM|nr:amidohydrolase family protein [Erwiniaceae bacterium PD-1]
MASHQRVIRLRAAWVVGYRNGDHCLVADGEVVWQGERILFVGRDYSGQVDEEIDAGNALAGPGFIDLDALGDLDTTVLAFDNQPGWRTGRIVAADWTRRCLYSREALDFNKRYAYSQLLLNGITTALPITSILYREWAETFDEYLYAADVAESLGIRAWLGPAFMSGHHVVEADGSLGMRFDEARGLAGLAQAVAFVERLEQRGVSRLNGMLAPDRIEGCTPGLLAALSEAVKALGCPTRLHCCQGELEVAEVARRYQRRSSIQVLHDYQLLNRQMILPHGQYLGGPDASPASIADDIRLLSASQATVVACPLVSGRHAKYLESFAALRQASVNLALGTDTFPPDMLTNLHIGTLLSRVVAKKIDAASAADYYRMATLGGAAALGRDDLGRLAPGAQADITLFSLDEPALGQIFDPITTLVINGNGRDLRGVIVAGEKVVWDRQLVKMKLDIAALHRQAQQQFTGLMATYPERSYQHPPLDQLFRPAFPHDV